MSRQRIVFDVSMAVSGGGFTYAVNVIPMLARRLAHAEILVALRSRRIAESLPTLENARWITSFTRCGGSSA